MVPEDWVRNFLLRAGMERTAECFEAEWFEVWLGCRLSPAAPGPHRTQLSAQGQLALEAPAPVPDAFARCESLEEAVRVRRAPLAPLRCAFLAASPLTTRPDASL